MKDEFTLTYCSLIQNQVEFMSSLTEILEVAASTGNVEGVRELRTRLEALNSRVTALTQELSARYDDQG